MDNTQQCDVNCERVIKRIKTHTLQIQLGMRILEIKKGTENRWNQFILKHVKMLRSRCDQALEWSLDWLKEDFPEMKETYNFIVKEATTMTEESIAIKEKNKKVERKLRFYREKRTVNVKKMKETEDKIKEMRKRERERFRQRKLREIEINERRKKPV